MSRAVGTALAGKGNKNLVPTGWTVLVKNGDVIFVNAGQAPDEGVDVLRYNS